MMREVEKFNIKIWGMGEVAEFDFYVKQVRRLGQKIGTETSFLISALYG